MLIAPFFVEDKAQGEDAEGLWRLVAVLLNEPAGYGPRDLPISGAWHRAADLHTWLDRDSAREVMRYRHTRVHIQH